MTTPACVRTVCEFLDQFAPSVLAADWDNVGLLVGDPAHHIAKIMTCLTVTPSSAAEAIEKHADLIVTHHPLPFRPLKKLTTETTSGRLLLDLIRADIAVYSPHTAFDSAARGINQRLADELELTNTRPLIAADANSALDSSLGTGRFGQLKQPQKISSLALKLKHRLCLNGLRMVGNPEKEVDAIGVVCGSGGELLEAAIKCGCQLLVTGETSFHTCLEAEATGISLLLPGHYASERFAVEHLAEVIAEKFSSLVVWPSCQEADPLRWL